LGLECAVRRTSFGAGACTLLTALFSDIHGNREALAACLTDARRMGAERMVFLGDIVGYGADPAWCVDTIAAKTVLGAVCIKGNHDAAISEPDPGMNRAASLAIEWTKAKLDQPQRAFLRDLPLTAHEGEALFVHANAWAPQDWGYVRSEVEAERSLRSTRFRLTFCGHTHVPAVYHMAPLKPAQRFDPVAGKPVPLSASRRWIAVLGSVGQPRDGNPAASYGLFSASPPELTLRRVPYDVESAARKVREAGLPETLADRLLKGR
jgi:diadenosine tetraphosphatase ApaH/serine/threonine PP2A family protein phosphatase